MKGIILAGGRGSRLYPLTSSVSKQLLPVYDKPMIYYPLSTLMLGGIREIMIISTPEDMGYIERLLGNGEKIGLSLQYKVQIKPEGLPQAYILAREFLNGSPSWMILGDNIFYGDALSDMLKDTGNLKSGGRIFGYKVKDPERYGVVKFDDSMRAISIAEKPSQPFSDFAITGLYQLDDTAPERAMGLRPSARGELEIVDLLETYLDEGKLKVSVLGRGYAWLDAGTHDSLFAASSFVKVIEDRQNLKMACIEEIAWRLGYIGRDELYKLAKELGICDYSSYLFSLCDMGDK